MRFTRNIEAAVVLLHHTKKAGPPQESEPAFESSLVSPTGADKR
jgi:hypothetical protein